MATIASTESYNITLVNTSSSGVQGLGYTGSPHITSNGRYVVFWSFANNLVSNDTNGSDIFVKDLVTGITTRVTTNSSGVEHNGMVWNSWQTPISDDGRFVVFASDASNLAPDDTNGVLDIYLKDLVTGLTTRLTNGFDGSQANGERADPSITPDGRYVLFSSAASNLVPGDNNGAWDTFVKDLATGVTTRVSTPNGIAGDITPDGRYVVFLSSSSDTKFVGQIFVRDLAGR